jgi:hypothetical protein
MIEVGEQVRKAFYNKISALTYNGNAVSVFDELSVKAQTTPYVILSSQVEQQTDVDVRDTFSASILIKITDAQSQSATKTNVEALGKLIFDAVKGDQIDFGTDWAIRGVKIQSTNYLTQDVGDKVYVQKIYRYSMDIENIS